MGAGNAGGRQDGNQMNSTVFNKVGVGRINEKGQSLEKNAFRNRGAENIKNSKFKTPATMILTKPLQAGSKFTRDFFTDQVLTSKRGMKNLGTTKEKFSNMSVSQQESIYGDYIDNRLSNKTDAYGNINFNTGQDKGNNNQPIIVQKNIGGQTVQTTETKVAEDKKEATQYDERVTKKKGRSKNILTSKQGVMKTSADYSLGKKSLLGQVV